MAGNVYMAVLGFWLFFKALEKGPVSLVSTITGSRHVFVLTYAFILSRLTPSFIDWQYGKGLLVLRVVSIAMIVGGITILYLT